MDHAQTTLDMEAPHAPPPSRRRPGVPAIVRFTEFEFDFERDQLLVEDGGGGDELVRMLHERALGADPLERELDLRLALGRFEVGLETAVEVLVAVVLVLQIDAVPLGALELPLEHAELLLQLRGVRGGSRAVAHASSPIRTVTKVLTWWTGFEEVGSGQISPIV